MYLESLVSFSCLNDFVLLLYLDLTGPSVVLMHKALDVLLIN